jgi:type VI secretion system protein ImpE
MNAMELYQVGRLDDAIQALGVGLRSDPTNVRSRTFLFELLCFAGEYERAEKHLDVLASSGKEADMGALLYRSALHAERTRQHMFRTGETPRGERNPRPVSGTLNGQPFESLTDADPRVGARLEIFAAGQYTWLPLEQVESVKVAPPTRLRDLLWIPTIVRTAPTFSGQELGEVLMPVLAPLSSDSGDPMVRLGRVTDWERTAIGTEVPVGQRLLLVDGEEFPILEVRELVITPEERANA